MKKRSSNAATTRPEAPARSQASDAGRPVRLAKSRTASKSTREPRARVSDPQREPTRRLSPEARRAQIIATAETLFNTRPYAELGVPEVARALGITPGLVYHYFPSKEALLVAAVELRARELLIMCIPDRALPFLQQVESAVKGYFDHVEAHSLAYRNLLRGPTASEVDVLRICEGVRVAIVDHFMAAGGFVRESFPATALAVRAYIGFSEHAILQWLETRELPRATIERMCLGMMIAAFRIGLDNDKASPFSPRQLADIERAYAEHFGLHLPAAQSAL